MRGRVRRSCCLRRGEGGGRRRRLRGCRWLHCWCGFRAATRDTLNSVPCRCRYHWLSRHYHVWSIGLATGRERHNQPQREQQELLFAAFDQHCEAPFQIRANGWSSIWRSLRVVKCPVGCLGGRPPISFDRFQSGAQRWREHSTRSSSISSYPLCTPKRAGTTAYSVSRHHRFTQSSPSAKTGRLDDEWRPGVRTGTQGEGTTYDCHSESFGGLSRTGPAGARHVRILDDLNAAGLSTCSTH